MTSGNDDDGEQTRPPRRSYYGHHHDEGIRRMFFRADYDPDDPACVDRFVLNMDFVHERRIARESARKGRARFFIWLFGGIGIALIGSGSTWMFQWLKLLP